MLPPERLMGQAKQLALGCWGPSKLPIESTEQAMCHTTHSFVHNSEETAVTQ